MRILLVTQYFWPEPFVINELVRHLASLGHEITVLTGKPNYPEGQIYAGYQQRRVQYEKYDDSVVLYRVPLRPRGNATSMKLIFNYLSFVHSGLWFFPRLVKGAQFDSILVFAPSPITSVIPAILLKWLKKAHLAVWVQDLWPESMAATGHIQHPLLLKSVRGLVRVIYKFSDTLLIQSKAFLKPISKLAATDKVVYYPNSMQVAQLDASCNLPSDLVGLLESRFCIVFAGNIGKAQAMETIVDAAYQLADEDIVIVLVGSGSMSSWVAEQKKLYSLHNLILAGRFPMDVMPEIYKRASGLLVTLKQEEILSYTVPSKIQAYLAAGKPIIASIDGEGARIVEEAEAGYTCPAEDGEALAGSILRLYETPPETRKAMGENGYRYFMEHFEMNRQAENLVNILQARINAQESS